MVKSLLFIVNPRAGKKKSAAPLFEAISVFSSAGYVVSVHQTQGQGDATQYVAQYGASFDAIACCGGDGTLNETINGMMQLSEQPPLCYLPAGSTNDFASSLRLSFEPETAAQASPKYYITVDLTNQVVTVYDNGNVSNAGIVRQMICSTGLKTQ